MTKILDILGYTGLGIVILVLIYLLLKLAGIVGSPTEEQLLTALVVGLVLHAFKIEGDLGKIKAKLKIG